MSTTSVQDPAPDGYVYDAERSDDPAQSIPAEMALLGACLNQPETATPRVVELLKAEYLYRPAHQAIYAAIVDLFDNGQSTDAITVGAELERRQEFLKIGGAPYLHALMQSTPVTVDGALQGWAEKVRQAAQLRRVGEIGGTFQTLAQLRTDTPEELDAVLERAQERLQEAVEWSSTESGAASTALGDHLSRVLATIEDRAVNGVQPGVLTGFADLDAVTNGLHPGQLVVVAGRPGLGKSTLAVDIARAAAIGQGLPSLVLSLEMSVEEVTERVLSAESGVRLHEIRKGLLSKEDLAQLTEKAAELETAPLHVLDAAGATITSLRAQARKLVRQHGIKLIVLDYLQLIESQGKAENRQIEVSGFSRKLKLLAKELQLPVVVAAQLNRGPENRQDHKPQVSDLRESGGIENDADLVVLIHRPDAYERDDPRMGEADLILGKNRSGPQATVTVAHQLDRSRFVDMGTVGMTWEDRFAHATAPYPVEAADSLTEPAGDDPVGA